MVTPDLLPYRLRQLRVLRIRNAEALIAADNLYLSQLLRGSNRKAAQPHRVQKLKDRCVCADTEPERGNRDQREDGTLDVAAQRVANILPYRLDSDSNIHTLCALFHHGRISKSQAGLARRCLCRHAGGNIVVGPHLEVGAKLLV
jgi:hypothetical protein